MEKSYIEVKKPNYLAIQKILFGVFVIIANLYAIWITSTIEVFFDRAFMVIFLIYILFIQGVYVFDLYSEYEPDYERIYIKKEK